MLEEYGAWQELERCSNVFNGNTLGVCVSDFYENEDISPCQDVFSPILM